MALVGTYLYKKDYLSITQYRSNARQQNLEYNYPRYNAPPEQKVNPIEKRSKWNTDAITLMGIVNNHNLSVAQNGFPRTDYIYINEDWTIDRIPNHVRLDEKSKEFLERFVRKN